MTNRIRPQYLEEMLTGIVGPARAAHALDRIAVPAAVDWSPADGRISAAMLAMTLNILLFSDLYDRVPTARRWIEAQAGAGSAQRLDHGALRTIRFPGRGTGALPGGIDAFARILTPLGYAVAADYPLPRLGMTGRAFRHRDLPDTIPQFFVSELHTDRFDAAFVDAADRVFGSSRDPLSKSSRALLDLLERQGWLTREQADELLPAIVAAFSRTHDIPRLADYDILRASSAEAAWIATEGNAFNHATSRVADVEALARQLRQQGYPVKDAVEHSASGRVHQTAFRADPVSRRFRSDRGSIVARKVPGSFYEFITRDVDPATGRIDLAFDSGNATGIFAVTQAAA
ncbi:MAG TPA: DUF1338 family protein [Sphingopyxis sp.]|mgnify:CR=1 FL=1|nr:DUF1338 family protein [Sphingopyxis sp.]